MIKDPDLFRVIDTVIYNFHMPLFFLLSGMILQGWVLRRPFVQAATSRVKRLIWPLILWTYVFAVARLAGGEHANTPVQGLSRLLFWPLPARDHFWFLWALFVQHIAILTLIRAINRPIGAAGWLALLAISLLISNLAQNAETALGYGVLTFAPALFAGLWLGSFDWRPRGALAFVIAGLVFAGLQAISFVMPKSFLSAQLVGILLALAVLTMVWVLCAGRGAGLMRPAAYLGVSSMGIYLAHTIFSAAISTAIAPYTVNLTVQMLAGTFAGIAGPLAIYFIIRKVGRPEWIGF